MSFVPHIVAPHINPIIILFASIFTGNILLTSFLGMCSFIAISKEVKSSMGLGIAVTICIGVTSMINWVVYWFLLVPFHIEYLGILSYIIVIAAFVQLLEMLIERFSPALYVALGIYLPLITVNCAVLGAVLFIPLRQYNFLQTTLFGFGAGIGWWLAILLLSAIRTKVDKSPVPVSLKGAGITLITIGFMAMAFTGFQGLLPYQ